MQNPQFVRIVMTENPKHMVIICPHFAAMRRTLFEHIEEGFIPKFKSLSINRQLKILLHGSETNNQEIKHSNGEIVLFTQTKI